MYRRSTSAAPRTDPPGGGLLEEDFQQRVMDLAKLYRWRCWHPRPARTAKGWRTAGTGDPGFPDLVLARNGLVLLVELKTNSTYPTPDQRLWIAAAGPNGYVWRPRDWDDIVKILRDA